MKASDECIDELSKEIKRLKEEIKQLKTENSDLQKKDPETIRVVLEMKADLEDKDKLIKALQNQNNEISADLENAMKSKSTMEESVAQLQTLIKQKESQFINALQKHSGSLNAMKAEVNKLKVVFF